MAQWHVSGSDSESDQGGEKRVEFCGLVIPPSRVLELLQSTEKRKTVQLDCLSDVKRKDRSKRRKHRRHKVTTHSPGAVRNLEEVSETASEIRSTISTTDCRDGRKPTLSRFDFCDDFPALTGQTAAKSKKVPRFQKHKEKTLAKMDDIHWKDEEVQQTIDNKDPPQSFPTVKHQTTPTENHLSKSNMDRLEPSMLHANFVQSAASSHTMPGVIADSSPMEVEPNHHPHHLDSAEKMNPLFPGFDDSDDSPTSELDMNHSLLSQINRVEQLLDAEGLS